MKKLEVSQELGSILSNNLGVSGISKMTTQNNDTPTKFNKTMNTTYSNFNTTANVAQMNKASFLLRNRPDILE
jgi:hypothetical protein